MSKTGFQENDGIASLGSWGVWNILLGLLFTFIGLFAGFLQLNSYYGMPIPFFVLAGVGILMVNSGTLFIVLYKLGTGISFRIGRHLAVQLGKEDFSVSEYGYVKSSDESDKSGTNTRRAVTADNRVMCSACKAWSIKFGDDGAPVENCSNCGAHAVYFEADS